MTPKVSIVFTSYNHREFLKQALDSLIAQTFVDFELIIIDDCSTDGSQDVLKEYAKDERVRLYLLEKNTGSYVHSSNLGASKVTTDYILFAQCDDFAQPSQVEKLYSAMISNSNVGVVFSSSLMVDEKGYVLEEDFNYRNYKFKKFCNTDTLINKKQMSSFLLQSCVVPNLSAALIKRSLFERQGGLSADYLVLADWDFWLKTSLVSNFYYLREPLNNFRQHDTTIRASVKLKRQVSEVFKMFYDFYELSNIGFFKKISSEYHISTIWYSYLWTGKSAWFKSFFSLLRLSIKKSFYFPLIFIINSVFYPFRTVYRKLFK